MRLPCDRCGKRRNPILAVNSYRIDGDRMAEPKESKDYELCAECRMAFRKFMKVAQ